MAKLTQITAIFGTAKVSDELFLGRLNAVYTGTNGNAAYPNPPIDMTAFKADIDAYSALITQALDGSKKVISEKKKKRQALAKSYRLLGRYVEIMCKNDMPTFLSSGFQAASTTRTPAQPLPPASILKVDHGNSGELLVTMKSLPRARSYDVRYAPVPAGGGTPATWTTETFASAKIAVPINGLTPGTNYAFQVRAFGKLGYTDWSESFTRVCA
jgi:Fibronectin type III domain